MATIFKSVLDNSIEYSFDDNAYFSGSIHWGAGMKVGESSNTISVPVKNLGDYLMSLANAMMGNDEITKKISYNFSMNIDESLFEFYRNIKDHPRKRLYYSPEFKRVSSVRSKQFDKRWHEVESGHDGSPEAVYDLAKTHGSAYGIIGHLNLATAVRDFFQKNPGKGKNKFSMPYPALFLDYTDNESNAIAIQNALSAVMTAIRRFELKREFETLEQSFRSNTAMYIFES